jgi:hypothetical protein
MIHRISRIVLRPAFARGIQSSYMFSEDNTKENLEKISQLLKVKYYSYNEQIPQSSNLRIIDDSTNQFIGIFDTKKAL